MSCAIWIIYSLGYTTTNKTRLSPLDIDSLEVWRLFNDLILVYKILFKLLDVDIDDLFDFADTAYDTRDININFI